MRIFSVVLIVSMAFYSCINAQSGKKVSFRFQQKEYDYYEYMKVGNPSGLLVLFDGGNGNAERLNYESKLPDSAAVHDLLTIAISYTESYLPEEEYVKIKACIDNAFARYKIQNKNLYIGGFSNGGSVAIRFTELLVQDSTAPFLPKAIFAIDPPLDYIQMDKYCDREITRDCNIPGVDLGKAEAQWLKQYYRKAFGDPIKDSLNYYRNSPYTMGAKNGGNAQHLLKIPIRFYHEINPMWSIKQRCRTMYDENILVSSEMINYLYQNGNKNAEIIISTNKGRRADGRIHPHSWSIVDSSDCIKWLQSFK